MTQLTTETARALWKEAEQETAFWLDHQHEYLVRYPDQFVAVHNGSVVAADHDLRVVIDRLTNLGVEYREVWLRYMDTHPVDFVL